MAPAASLGATEYAIVTDSGCDLPAEFLEKLGVTCVELRVQGEAGNEQVLPPTPEELAGVYRALAEDGAEAVLSLHSSSVLSDAAGAATLAADMVDVPVRVVDTGCVSVALGIVVDCAACCRNAGGTLEDALSAVASVADQTSILFIPAPSALPESLHGLGRAKGLLAHAASIRQRLSGERRLISIRRGERPEELFRHVDLADLTGRAVRAVSIASQAAGPVYYAVVDVHSGSLLHKLEKPLDTNEFEHHKLGVVSAGAATIASAGEGAIAIAYVPQAVYDAAATFDDKGTTR